MSKLYDFLIKLSQDTALMRAFARDSIGLMEQHGLNANERAAILSGDLDRIYEVAGSRGLVICKVVWVTDPDSEDESGRRKRKVKG